MDKENKIPRYLIADASPDEGEKIWLVRTRPHLIMFGARQTADGILQLYPHPANLAREMPRNKLTRIMDTVAQIYMAAIDDVILKVNCVFDDEIKPPPWLLADAANSDWEGIIHTVGPRFIAAIDVAGLKIVHWVDDVPDPVEVNLLANEALGFYRNYEQDSHDA